MSENVKITRAETMSQNFRHIVISTHKSVEMCRAETMCTFSLRKKFVKKCDIHTDGRTDGRTDRQSLLEDASRIKNTFFTTGHHSMYVEPTCFTQLVPQNHLQVPEKHQQLISGVKEYVFDPICSEKIGFSVKKMSISIQNFYTRYPGYQV